MFKSLTTTVTLFTLLCEELDSVHVHSSSGPERTRIQSSTDAPELSMIVVCWGAAKRAVSVR